MKRLILFVLTGLILANHSVMAEDLPDTSQVSIKIINTKNDPFDKQIVLTDKASQKVITTIHTKELDPWPMNGVQADRTSEYACKWFLSKEKEGSLPKERRYDYQNRTYYEGVDSDYMTQLYKFIQIEISPKGQYFMVLFVYKILDGEGQDLAGRTSFFLFDMTGKNVSKYKDDLSSTGDRSYFTDDDAFFTFAFIQPSIDYDMERPYKGMRILTIPGLQVIKTYLYDNHSLWWQAPPRAQGKYILIGLNNYKTNQWGFDIINPYSQTKSRKVYTKAEYTYPTTTSKGIRVKVSEGTTRVDSFKNFDYQGF